MTDATPMPDLPPGDALPPPPESGRAVASIGTRLGGFLLELVLIPCTFGFGWVGWWIIAWADGQTPSKVVLHLHVVNADDGQLASFGRMALREALGKGIGGVLVLGGVYEQLLAAAAAGVVYALVGATMALTDNRRRTAWDHLARTVVVEGDPPPLVLPPAPIESAALAGLAADSAPVSPPEAPGTSPW